MSRRFLVATVVLGLLSLFVAACSEHAATHEEADRLNTGVTGKSIVAALLQPEEMGKGWGQRATNQFMRPQDLPNTSACTPVKGYVSASQAGLDAESQHTIKQGIDPLSPEISEELRVFKSEGLTAPIMQALQALISTGSWHGCKLDQLKAQPRSAQDPVATYAEATPLTPGPAGSIAYRIDERWDSGGVTYVYVRELHAWTAGRRMLTLEVSGDLTARDGAFVDMVIEKATTAANRLDR